MSLHAADPLGRCWLCTTSGAHQSPPEPLKLSSDSYLRTHQTFSPFRLSSDTHLRAHQSFGLVSPQGVLCLSCLTLDCSVSCVSTGDVRPPKAKKHISSPLSLITCFYQTQLCCCSPVCAACFFFIPCSLLDFARLVFLSSTIAPCSSAFRLYTKTPNLSLNFVQTSSLLVWISHTANPGASVALPCGMAGQNTSAQQ